MMASRDSQEELRDFTIAFISLLAEDLNSPIFSDIKNIFRDVYRQKLMSILMASGSQMDVKITCKAITGHPGKMPISSLTSEDDDALIILTTNSNVLIGSAILKNVKKKNEDAMLPLQIVVIDGKNQRASFPYSGIIERPDIPVAPLLFMNTVTMDDLHETNDRTSDKDGIESHRDMPAGLTSLYEVSSSGSEIHDVCSQRRNPISTRRGCRQRKMGWSTGFMTSKSCDPCETTSKNKQMPISLGMLFRHEQRKTDFAVNQMNINGTSNSPTCEKGFVLESQQESKVHHARRSFDEPSCLDAIMKFQSQIVQKTRDMNVRLETLNEDSRLLFPKMTKPKTMSPETMDSYQKWIQSWKAPFRACAQILRRMSAPENSRIQPCEELNKDPEEEILAYHKKESDVKTESKHNEGRDECEKYNFQKTLMQNCKERSKSHPSNDNTNPLSNASVSVVDASLNNQMLVDIFENLCQTVHKMAISSSSNRRITDPFWINRRPLTQIIMKRKVTA